MSDTPPPPMEDCPYCPNQGWYNDTAPDGEHVQVQCEFCWTNPLSKFNNAETVKAKAKRDASQPPLIPRRAE